LKDQGRTYLAWHSIVIDIENGVLNQDLAHLTQAKANSDGAKKQFDSLIRDTYKWLLAPLQEPGQMLEWEVAQIASGAPKLIQEIENRLVEEEWLIKEWSPVHLRNLLDKYYFSKGAESVSALKVWQDACQYLYMPRLVNDSVLRHCIEAAIQGSDYFAFASSQREDRFEGFAFGKAATVFIDEHSLLISREAALRYQDKLDKEKSKTEEQKEIDKPSIKDGDNDTKKTTGTDGEKGAGGDGLCPLPTPPIAEKTRFYGSVRIDPIKAKMDFATLMDEVVQNFTSQLGVDVEISIEINARSGKGFDANLQRAIKENCSMLKFGNAEFEE